MKNFIALFAIVLTGLAGLRAQAPVTFSEHIAPIIYNNCTSCHRPGEIGPISFTNYSEVRAWAGLIKYVTEINYMPPWKPDRSYSTFVGEKGLTDAEVQLISDWVAQGSPQGDPNLEPPLPYFPPGSQLGTPDLVLEMAEDYTIQGNNQDDYRVFVLPSGLTTDKEIAAIEFRPGNPKVVHHALIAYESQGAAAAMDSLTPEYGYESFGDFGVTPEGTFTGYTPGIETVRFPVGIGTTLPAGADLLIQVHYAPLPTTEVDRSKLNIFFKDETDTIVREVERNRISPFDLVTGPLSFSIPPDQITTFHGTKDITEDISLINVYPHMHYLGKDWEIYAVTPANDTIPVIKIDDWDFNWQGAYTFNRLLKIPANSVLHVFATYDNTSSNPFNPNNPPQTSTWGEGTTDEMYLVGIAQVPYEPGDENIVVVGRAEMDLLSANSQFVVFPNPSHDVVTLSYELERGQTVSLDLIDANGRSVQQVVDGKRFAPGHHSHTIEVGDLPAGIYTVRLSNGDQVVAKSLSVLK